MVSLADAEDAIQLADAYGVCDGFPLAESQKITLRNGMGTRADGSWAASRIADFGPRQGTGKNDKIAVRELAGLILFGEQLQIHTAHEFPTANESFLRLVALFENWDDLRKRVRRVLYGNGTQSINFLSGQRILYKARTGGAGRGFAKADLVVYDEAQHLGREQVAASGPAKMANPNAQTWYAGSGGLATSVVAWGVRRAALLGTGGRLAYTEMTGETITVDDGQIRSKSPDPLDRDVWYRCIPGLGRWVTEEAVQAQYEEHGPELFAREILCVWDPDPTDGLPSIFAPGVWEAVNSHDVVQPEHVTFAVEVNVDRTHASIAVAGAGGSCGLLERRVGVGWVVDELVRIAKPRSATVAVSSTGPSGSLIADLERAGVKVHVVTGPDMAKACGWFHTSIVEKRLVVQRHVDLDAAVTAAVKKTSGDAYVWDRRAGDISALVAVTLAAYVAQEKPSAKPLFVF